MACSVCSLEMAPGHENVTPPASRDGVRTVVWLEGEQDVATVAALAETLAGAMSVGDGDLIVDLSGVTFFGAATVGELIRGRNVLRAQSRNLTLRSPSKSARCVLDVCGLTALLEAD